MNINYIILACCILATAVMSLASTSIAQQCYNDNSSYKTSHTTNNDYLTYMIVMGVVFIVASFGGMFLGYKAPA
jgi:hypothetical protein